MPAVKLAEKVGINSVVNVTRRFGITTSLPPYLPLALGSADMRLLEHVSAFTVFPNDGIRIDPHMIRRVTSYDGALLEEAHPEVHDVVSPEVARTMTAMLEEVIQFGTGIQAKSLGRPAAGKTGTTQDYTDAWFIGFTPQITSGVWVGFDDKQISLGKKETGARAALPIWMQFMTRRFRRSTRHRIRQRRPARTTSRRPRSPRGHARHRSHRGRTRRPQTKTASRNPPPLRHYRQSKPRTPSPPQILPSPPHTRKTYRERCRSRFCSWVPRPWFVRTGAFPRFLLTAGIACVDYMCHRRS